MIGLPATWRKWSMDLRHLGTMGLCQPQSASAIEGRMDGSATYFVKHSKRCGLRWSRPCDHLALQPHSSESCDWWRLSRGPPGQILRSQVCSVLNRLKRSW